MTAEKARGPEIVLMEGEELLLSENELEFLALGPKYCLLNTCSYEVMCCQVETAICKHKWDCMSREDDNEEERMTITEEERIEDERLEKLAEELSA